MKCKYCNQEIDEGSVFCGYCGKKQPEVKYCIKCGQEIGLEDIYCGYCGTSQLVEKKEISLQEEQRLQSTNQPNEECSLEANTHEINDESNDVESVNAIEDAANEDKRQYESELGRSIDNKNKPQSKKNLIIVLVAIVVIIGGILLFIPSNENRPYLSGNAIDSIGGNNDVAQDNDNQEAIKFLKDFYDGPYWEDSYVRKYITNNARQVLNDYYDYDCDADCLATWMFADGGQQCDSKFTQSIIPQGSNKFLVENKLSCGTYSVLLTLVHDGNSFKIDNIEPKKYVNQYGTYDYETQKHLTNIFTVVYATSDDGFVNVREKPSSNAKILGQIDVSECGLGALVEEKGEWSKISKFEEDGSLITGWTYSKYLGTHTWFNEFEKEYLIAIKDDTPIYVDIAPFDDCYSKEDGLDLKLFTKVKKGTIIASDYGIKNDYYELPRVSGVIYVSLYIKKTDAQVIINGSEK